MANFNDIDKARKILKLGDQATLKEIKSAYRKMAFDYHPDKQGNSSNPEHDEMMKMINWAYKILTQYCHDFRYTFKQEDVARTYFYEEQERKWKDNWFNSI